MAGSQLNVYFTAIMELVDEAGEMIRKAISQQKNVETKAGFADLVTETDQGIEALLIGKLREKFPDHRFIGEEGVSAGEMGAKQELTNAPTWIIDPVDGTTNFVHTFPFCCVSVALAVNKEVVIGIVYNPMLELKFVARKDLGSTLNGKPIKASSCTDIAKSLIFCEFGSSREPDRMDLVCHNLRALGSASHGIRAMGSAALNMSFVAAGHADAYQEFGLHCWDMAAASLIITEAGGVVMDTEGGPLDLMARRVLCAGTKELALSISKLLKQVTLERD